MSCSGKPGRAGGTSHPAGGAAGGWPEYEDSAMLGLGRVGTLSGSACVGTAPTVHVTFLVGERLWHSTRKTLLRRAQDECRSEGEPSTGVAVYVAVTPVANRDTCCG
jgi:hypothetical protein